MLGVAGEPFPHAAEAAVGMLSSDSEQVHQNVDASSAEFERLMEDSVCSDPVAGFLAPASAFARSPGRALESPPRWPDAIAELGGASPLLRASGAAASGGLEATAPSAGLTLSPSTLVSMALPSAGSGMTGPLSHEGQQQASAQMLRGSGDASGRHYSEEPWIMSQLSGRIDAIARELKRSVEHEFALAERTLQGQHRSALEAQKMKADALVYQQQANIESLQSENQQLSRRLDLKQRQLKDALGLLQRARRGWFGRCAQERVILAWKASVAAAKDSRTKELLAAGLFGKRSAAQLFGAWRRMAHFAAVERVVSHERATADMVRAKLFEQMESERTRTSSEVDRLTRLLKEEEQQRALLQENLKRVFMRGVCALNFEAMTLLSDGTSAAEAVPGEALPAAGGFNWADFEARTLGATGPGDITTASSELPQGMAMAALGAAALQGANFASSPVGPPPAESRVVSSPAGTRPSSPSQVSSPRRPPVPSQPPVQASGQLPFVNWSSSPAVVQQPAAKVSRGSGQGSHMRVPSRGQLRHPATAARGLAHPRPEMVTVK